MSEMIESAEVLAIGFACSLAGVALALAYGGRKSTVAKARRVAEATAEKVALRETGWFKKGVEVRLARVETDARVHHSALQVHGLMQGERVAPDRAEPPRIFRPATLNGEEAAS